jgi:hypothetical protein
MPGTTEFVSVSIAIAMPVPISVSVSTPIAVPVTAFVAVASPAVSITATIVAIVAALATLFPVESTDIAIAIAAIPPSIWIAIILRQDGAGFERVSCAGRAAKRKEGNGRKKDLFHFVTPSKWQHNRNRNA